MQSFNLTFAAELANDLMMDARNFTRRLNDSAHLEEELVRFYLAKFTGLNVNLNNALQMQLSKTGPVRQKRNIIGSLLSSLTGLVTREGKHVHKL
jgi:hypothetical protein